MFKLHLYDLSGLKVTGEGWGDDGFSGAEINSSGEVSIEITATGLNIYEGHLSAEEVATATPIQVLNYDIPGLAGFRITGGPWGEEDFQGKYTVGDLVYCSTTRCFYAFPEEKPNSITDLTNTTWYFKDSLEHCWIAQYTDLQCVSAACYNAGFAVNLVVNDNQYDYLSFGIKGEGSPMSDDNVYYENLDSGDFIEAYWVPQHYDEEYADTYGWEDESYRTITITGGEDVTNPDLITWITTNAVQTDISKPDTPEEVNPTFTFDLSTLNLVSGKYTIYVTLGADGYKDSEPSNEVVYEVAEAAVTLTTPHVFYDDEDNILTVTDYEGIATNFDILVDGEKKLTVDTTGDIITIY